MSVTRRQLIVAVAAATVATSVRGETAPAAPPASAESEARIALILGRYGDRFTEQQKTEIARNIRGSQSGFDAMRAYPLDNSVEPATLFRVHRRTGRPSRVRTEKS